MHAIYAAFFDFQDMVFVKVGRSSTPYKRVVTIAAGCPHVLSAAVFAHVGAIGIAQAIEGYLQASLAEHRTRGEWFMFPKAEGVKFAQAVREAFGQATGRPLRWTNLDVDAIRQEMLDAFKAYRGGRSSKLARVA